MGKLLHKGLGGLNLKLKIYVLSILFLFLGLNTIEAESSKKALKHWTDKINLSKVKFRSVGPGFVSGRIADIAIHPLNKNIWYVAVGSGGVWKTLNRGTTWQAIFDKQPVYSTGSITIDPSNPSIIWVGTGENVGGRHVGFGDGIYKSLDDGKSWQNMGLKTSEHISKIIVHPNNSNTIWVASQGPLWSKGGERGVYKSNDGGKTWKQTLGDDQWMGATDLLIDPRNPNILYAATWERHRTVAAYMGGGPGTGIYKSEDGGETWNKIHKGLPRSNMGKIGLAISPIKPDVIYAAIELDRRKGAVYKSTNRGASWTKQSNTVSGGTGPHYYQELIASPHVFDRLYLMNVRTLISENGGKTFKELKEREKHSDNHALVFDPDDPNYLLIGTDAGLYESFDHAENWSYLKNLPLTQFYKVAVNNKKPFYHIFGGTQDNGSLGGPSRTDDAFGIRNADWYKILFADGHQTATDPENPNIVYAETQQGGLHRIDLVTGEPLFIQPQAKNGENPERFNWDAPILVSPHKASRLYFASQRLWKSEDRGDSWTAISKDLTRNQNRFKLPIMGKKQGWDKPWDIYAMSKFNTITSIAESPLKEGLIMIGTDDGLLALTKDGGKSWKKIPINRILGVPKRAFVNDVKADLFDKNTFYVVLDNHKEGDYKPYVYRTKNLGLTWQNIGKSLPEKHITWRIVQDPVKKELFFLATEFGVFASLDSGKHWQKLGGTPTIAFRDLVIQKDHNDLVAASFGRGFFVLDDYSFLREITAQTPRKSASLFKARPALRYIERNRVGNTGADMFRSPNPAFGATFHYFLKNDLKSLKEKRKLKERKESQAVFPSWKSLDAELREIPNSLWLIVSDKQGKLIQKIKAPHKKGLQKVTWNLSYGETASVKLGQKSRRVNRWNKGPLVLPGNYYVQLWQKNANNLKPLSEKIELSVINAHQPSLSPKPAEQTLAFYEAVKDTELNLLKVNDQFSMLSKKMKSLNDIMNKIGEPNTQLQSDYYQLRQSFLNIQKLIEGNLAKQELRESDIITPQSSFFVARRALGTTYGPTKLHLENLEFSRRSLKEIETLINSFEKTDLSDFEQKLKSVGDYYIRQY